MKVTDLLGKAVEVEDLDLALLQADDYRHYRRSDPSFAVSDIYLAHYWEDKYQKLLKLKDGAGINGRGRISHIPPLRCGIRLIR